MEAIEQVTANPELHTGDLGGKATTAQVTQAVCSRLEVARKHAVAA
jgi:tartrate dehydrogenase/decarboxylase/D-malate dehydrogenase